MEQEKQQRLDELKADLYKLRRSFPKSEELAALQQKIDRLTELYDEKISAERGNLMALKSKVVSLERQYAQNNRLEPYDFQTPALRGFFVSTITI